MPVYAVGDVQGCYAELRALLRKIAFDPTRDQIWFVGDLVNRGPDSLKVLRHVHALGSAARVVLGNHDLHLLAVAFGGRRRLRANDTLDAVLAARDRDDLLEWLRHQPLLHHDAALGWTMVHAGLPPQWSLSTARRCAREVEKVLREERSARRLFEHLYGNRPDRWSDRLRGHARLRFIVNCLTRLRVCDAKGRLELGFKGGLDQVPDGLVPWFRAPARRTRRQCVVSGHWSALDYYEGDGILALDTGCAWGRRLCAVRLDCPATSTDSPSTRTPVWVRSRQARVHDD